MARGIDALKGLMFPLMEYESGTDSPDQLWVEGGSSSNPIADNGVADKKWVGLYTKTTATSGDNRGLYWKHSFAGAGSGEVLRPYASVETTNVATGGTVNAIHAGLAVATSSSVSGAGNAIRATLEAAAATRTLGGTCAALQLDSYIGENNTVPASWSFIRITDTGSVALKSLFNFPAAATAGLIATHTTDAMTHSVKCVINSGTVVYLMATTTATNRTNS